VRISPWALASSLEQAVSLLCAQANSASYSAAVLASVSSAIASTQTFTFFYRRTLLEWWNWC